MKKKRRGYSRYFIMLLLAIGIFTGISYGIKTLICHMPLFTIKKVIITGNENLEKEFLHNLVSDLIGRNLFIVNRQTIATKFANLIRVKKVRVTRLIPASLRVHVEERKAFFYIRSLQGNLYPVDDELLVLDRDSFYPGEIVPVIDTNLNENEMVTGARIESEFIYRVSDFCDQIKVIDPEFLNRISEFYAVGSDIYMVDNEKGFRIVFGKDGYKDKYCRFSFLEKNRNFDQDDVVDLRFTDRLIVRTEGI
ncbi:MAG: FtsQ-type POTRA domain-containing protein [Candidatus Cloacimonetes bacterium]|nr:FtsQ-type POTRA domain-containing protein [Candidatus Cloacimonadota bacterium]